MLSLLWHETVRLNACSLNWHVNLLKGVFAIMAWFILKDYKCVGHVWSLYRRGSCLTHMSRSLKCECFCPWKASDRRSDPSSDGREDSCCCLHSQILCPLGRYHLHLWFWLRSPVQKHSDFDWLEDCEVASLNCATQTCTQVLSSASISCRSMKQNPNNNV